MTKNSPIPPPTCPPELVFAFYQIELSEDSRIIHGEWSNTYAVIANSEADGACYFKYPHMTASYLLESSGGSGQMGFDASRICSLYQTGMNEVRVNAIFGFNLIRAF